MKKISLRVDVDTLSGSMEGIPSLLRMLGKHHIQAGFYFSFGPDNSGRAIRRVFRKGFLEKMSRTNALKLYGLKTMLYGTLWPAPMIHRKAASLMRSVASEGHEVAIHAWDHVEYHDLLDHKSQQWLENWYSKAHEAFEKIFNRKAKGAASPAWRANDRTLLIQEKYQLDYAGDCRGTAPFYPIVNNQILKTIQIPTTLPTVDELLGLDGRDEKSVNNEIWSEIREDALNVYALHTEVEGGALSGCFDAFLSGLKPRGIQTITHEQWLPELKKGAVPSKIMGRTLLPGRAGWVSTG